MNEKPTKQIMDGCTAATHVAYALSEIATIYPITPVASMGETADRWAMQGRKNLMGQPLHVKEMESELGAAGATHGALAAGALATTFTASQGLMLMIPNMYKIAGELLPAVFHVGTRSLATHALSIFGDHQDVMACRATGFAMLASASVQETMDLALVAHLAAIDGRVPVLHFFDGWRTSNESSTIDVIPYESMAPMVNWDKVRAFRDRALNPAHPTLRGSAQNSDVYFQNAEASNPYYLAFPEIVQKAMDRCASVTGRQYHLADYYGASDATDIIICMGSSTGVVEETVDWLNTHGYKTGVVKLRLFRPFPARQLLEAIPASVKRIAVLDRTKEPGSSGEPLYLDVAAAVLDAGRPIKVIGGRYGLSSKEFNPVMVKAVFDNLMSEHPIKGFTVGIDDDVTHLSLDISGAHFIVPAPGMTQAIFYGMGSDGTVGATRQIADCVSSVAPLYAQAFFNYSAKKSGGYTISQLRFAPAPIKEAYSIIDADYVGCNKNTYVDRFEMLDNIKPGGIFVLNSPWSAEELDAKLPPRMKRAIASKNLRFYNIDANSLAQECGLGVRINSIMTTVFLHLMSDKLPFDAAMERYRQLISQSYLHEGQTEVQNNLSAIGKATGALKEIKYPSSWTVVPDIVPAEDTPIPDFIKDVARPCLQLLGSNIPVSALTPDGTMPMGTTAYEKRRIAVNIPRWTAQKCVQCTECSLVCPHAAIRPYLLSEAEDAAAPQSFTTAAARYGGSGDAKLFYRIQVFPDDCVGCGSCATICPGKALDMVPIASIHDVQTQCLDYVQTRVTRKNPGLPPASVIATQFRQPLMQFSGACAGCGETPYVKLLTQLFGQRLLIANATGCSSIWGADFPSNAYCADTETGRGPAWGNSLFEDNAEYGFGMACATAARRATLAADLSALAADAAVPSAVRDAAQAWLMGRADAAIADTAGTALVKTIKAACPDNPVAAKILERADMLPKQSVWAIGGDGWAYDIGFAGLDHVLAQDIDINILVMDTECYSNTGGQVSKATPLGAVMKYAADGKRTIKKDLGRMMMTYGNIYVASVALGANYVQTIKALMEAEAYPGPSIVIAYCPCINHGIRSGMSHAAVEQKLAVKAGYWPLYRYNPALTAQGKPALTVDCAAPDGSLITFINGENRYADLRMVDPREAAILQPQLQKHLDEVYSIIVKQQ